MGRLERSGATGSGLSLTIGRFGAWPGAALRSDGPGLFSSLLLRPLAPTTLDGFNRQRQRWSRGMIEGLKEHLDIIWSHKGFSSFFIGVDLLFPIIDAFYTFVFLPGVILAFFGIWYIAGPMTLLVFPIQIIIILKMILSQKKFMESAGLRIRRNRIGLFFYGMIYQIIHSPICLLGYFKEIARFKRKW